MRPLTLLALWQLKNTLRTTLTQPRKLIPVLVFLGWLGLQLVNAALVFTMQPPPASGAESMIMGYVGLIRSGAFLLLVFLTLAILDTGFTGGFLAFALPDVDYLFPSPISRRLVLAYRLFTKTGQSLLQATFVFYLMFWKPMDYLAPGRYGGGEKLASLLAVYCCIGGFANVAFLCKLIFGFGRLSTVRRWIIGLLVLLLGGAAYVFWRFGPDGFEALARHEGLGLLFFPCRLAADTLSAPLLGEGVWSRMPLLATFYGVSAALLFSRRENFYEPSLEGTERFAKRLQAAREQNWGAMFGGQGNVSRASRKRGDGTPYAIPAFGRGAAALFWAHMAAAAKRPFANFLLPFAAGVGLTLFAWAYAPPRMAALLVSGGNAYVLIFLTVSGIAVFRQGLQRQGLVRPLPLPNWGAVLADVLPRTLLCSLAPVGSGVALLTTRLRHADEAALLLLLYLPTALVGLNLVQYVLALIYPEAQDKFQQMVAGFISLFLNGLAMGVFVALVVIPPLLHAPPWLAALCFLLPVTLADAGLLLLASWMYGRFEPKR